MKRKLINSQVKQAVLALPAAAMMLGAAHAGTSVGINFQASYYGGGGYAGAVVTNTAFGISAGDWFNTTVDAVNDVLTVTPSSGGSFGVSWSAAGSDISWALPQYSTMPGYVGYPGDCQVYHGNITGPYSVSLSGLTAQFPSGYVVQALAAGNYATGMQDITVTDNLTIETLSYTHRGQFDYGWGISGSYGVYAPTTNSFTSDTLTINGPDGSGSIYGWLSGFIVTDKPVNTVPPVGATLATGGTITLNAGVIGIAPLHYQWRTNGVPIPGANSATYTKAGAVVADSANYDVVVTNLAGAVTSLVATVSVAAPATLTWDADSGAAGAQDGNGSWGVSTSGWWSGTSDVAWSPLSFALFGAGGAGAYTVTLTNDVSASGLTFNSGNYTLANTAGQSIALGGAAAITANTNATIALPLAGTAGLTKSGNGTLTLTARNSFTGTTTVSGGTLNLPTAFSGGNTTLKSAIINLLPGTTLTCDSGAFGWYANNNANGLTININGATCQPNGAFGVAYILTGGTIGTGTARLDLGRSGGFDAAITSLASATTSVVNPAGGVMLRSDSQQTAFTFTAAAGTTPSGIDLDVQGAISQHWVGPASLTKAGDGTLRLSSGNSTYSGGTTVNGGTLAVSGGRLTGDGAMTLADNTALKVSALGGTAAIALNSASLTVGTGAGTNLLDFAGLSSTSVAPISVGGYVYIANPTTVNISSVSPVVGQYPLVKCLGGAYLVGLKLGTLPSGITASLVDDTYGASQSVYLDVTAVATPVALWTGATSGLWDINTTANWTVSGSPATYAEGYLISFDDTAVRMNVVLNTTVKPGAVTFDNETTSYTLSGTGGIAGSTGLSKTGNGTLTIATTNTYTGETAIDAGTLQLNDGVLATSGITNSGALVYNLTGNQSVAYAIRGPGMLTKAGPGTLTLNVNSSLTGETILSGGVLALNAYNALRYSPITVSAGTILRADAQNALQYHAQPLTVKSGATLTTRNGNTSNIGGHSGSLMLEGGATLTSGTPDPTWGSWTFNTADYSLAVAGGSPVAAVMSAVNMTAAGGSLTLNVADVTGDEQPDLVVSGNFSAAGGVNYGLSKDGTGTAVLNGTNTYTGPTAVNNGTLLVNGKLGTEVVTVAAGATLGGTGLIPGMVTVDSGATLAPGAPTGTLILSNTPSLNGTVRMELNRTNSPNAARLAVAGNPLVFGGELTVVNTGPALKAGDTFILFSAEGGLSGEFTTTNLPALSSGLFWKWNSAANMLSLSVGSTVPTNPTNVTANVVNGKLALSWPADHLGWSLQLQTNALSMGLGTNWVTVPGSEAVTSTNLPINPANPAVFFRLVYP